MPLFPSPHGGEDETEAELETRSCEGFEEALNNGLEELEFQRVIEQQPLPQREPEWKGHSDFAVKLQELATVEQKAINVTDRIDEQICDAVLKLGRKTEVKQPWQILPSKRSATAAMFNTIRLPMLGRFERPVPTGANTEGQPVVVGWLKDMPFAGRRLLAARLTSTDDNLKMQALKKLRNIVLFHPADSQLGRSLLDKAGSLVGLDELERSLHDCVAGKAVGTLAKRMADFHRFALWQVTANKKRPLNPNEADFYEYLKHLQQVGAGATAGLSFLKSWNFMRFTVGAASHTDSCMISGRVKGVSQNMFAKKRKLAQAPPLPQDYVYQLEMFVIGDSDPHLQTIAGFLLFCVYSCARFGDAARGVSSDLSFQRKDHISLVECSLSEYKTATGERKAVLLPLISLGSGLADGHWSLAWREARKRSGADRMHFIMSADNPNNDGWVDRRMTTAEGTYWLRDILVHLGVDAAEAGKYSTHSLKATCLSWAAKAGAMSVPERLWLGHHQSDEAKMVVTYARDAIAAVMVKLRRILDAMRAGTFDPDLSRVERIAQATGMQMSEGDLPEKTPNELEVEEMLQRERESRDLEPDESDVEESEGLLAVPLHFHEDADAGARRPFPEVDLKDCVRHRLSGIVHVIVAEGQLACVRKLTCNLAPLPKSTTTADMDLCEQCRHTLKLA